MKRGEVLGRRSTDCRFWGQLSWVSGRPFYSEDPDPSRYLKRVGTLPFIRFPLV